jgi:hypothetical protein
MSIELRGNGGRLSSRLRREGKASRRPGVATLTARSAMRRLVRVGPPSVVVLLLVGATVASATPVQVTSFPWAATPGNYAGGSPVHGACNLKENLSVAMNPSVPVVTDTSGAWGFSLACQLAVRSSSLSGLGGSSSPDLSLPGAAFGL